MIKHNTETLNQNELTKMERTTLKALIKKLYAEYGFSDVTANDLQQVCKFENARSISGVIASLSKKGFVMIEDFDNGNGKFEFIHLTEEAERFHPDHASELSIDHEELN